MILNFVLWMIKYAMWSVSIWYFTDLFEVFHFLWVCLLCTISHDTLDMFIFFFNFVENTSKVFSATADERLSRRNDAVTVNLQISDKYFMIYSLLNFFLFVVSCASAFEFNLQNRVFKVFFLSNMFSLMTFIISLMLKFFSQYLFNFSHVLCLLFLS